jgi:hypothetical protein
MFSKENDTNKYIAIAESTYSKSFWSAIVFVVILIIVNILNENIDIEVIDFVKDILWIFVLPITVKIIGVDSIPKITELIRELKGNPKVIKK